MLRLLFCSAFIAPVFFLPGLIGGQDASASFEATTDTYEELTEHKLDQIEDCEAETIGVFFRDEFVTTHSAEYLQSAVDVAADCDATQIRLIKLQHPGMTADEKELANTQLEEVVEFIDAYEIDADVDTTARKVEPNNLTLNGRTVLVEFDFNQDTVDK